MGRPRQIVLAAAIATLVPAPAIAQITFLNYSGVAGDARVSFQRVGVTRGSSNYAYWDTEIILPRLNRVNYATPNSQVNVLTPSTAPHDGDVLLRDLYLNTGISRPGAGDGTSFAASDNWTQVTFDKPIVNSPGPDGVLATLQFLWVTPNYFPAMISTSAGHSYLFPKSGGFAGGESNPNQYLYPAGVYTPDAMLTTTPVIAGGLNRPTWVLQAFDLSTMGIAAGASVSSLYLQEWSGNNGNGSPISFVAGFPPVTRLGDFNFDGAVNKADVPAMLKALTNLNSFQTNSALTPETLLSIADLNSDGKVTNADIQPLLSLIATTGGGAVEAPEPATLVLLAIAGISVGATRATKLRVPCTTRGC
jgi:hypothetical protein